MRTLTGGYGIVGALAFLSLAAGQDSDDAKQELQNMQGGWRVVSSQVGDEQASADEVKQRKTIIKGNTLTYVPSSGPKDTREGTIKLDPKTKAFDWACTVPEAGTMLAIYELKGDDLKIGFGNDGMVRPRRFVIGKEDVVWLLVLKREKP